MKTRLEALEHHQEQAFLQLIAQEIDIKQLEVGMIVIKPGGEYEKAQKLLQQRKTRRESLEKLLKIIGEMIAEERKEVKSGD